MNLKKLDKVVRETFVNFNKIKINYEEINLILNNINIKKNESCLNQLNSRFMHFLNLGKCKWNSDDLNNINDSFLFESNISLQI